MKTEIKVGSRVVGTCGLNHGRRMTVIEIRDAGRIYVMSNGAFLGFDEISLIP